MSDTYAVRGYFDAPRRDYSDAGLKRRWQAAMDRGDRDEARHAIHLMRDRRLADDLRGRMLDAICQPRPTTF